MRKSNEKSIHLKYLMYYQMLENLDMIENTCVFSNIVPTYIRLIEQFTDTKVRRYIATGLTARCHSFIEVDSTIETFPSCSRHRPPCLCIRSIAACQRRLPTSVFPLATHLVLLLLFNVFLPIAAVRTVLQRSAIVIALETIPLVRPPL